MAAVPLAFISEFNVQMLYLRGLRNVADCLSCLPLPLPGLPGTVATAGAANPVDFEAMAAEQNHCAEMQRLLSSSSLKIVFQQAGAQRLFGNVSTGTFCPIVPAKFRNDIFCICTTFPTLGGLPLGVSANRGKIHRHTRLLLQPIPIPQQQFTHLHIDLVGPLQYSIAGQKIIKVLKVH
jgi:hypothetical protein